jgi:hypothetical protein
MADPNTKNFQGRLKRIDHIHRAGGGFEAVGTLGKSYYTAHRSQRRSFRLFRLFLVIAIVLLALKVGMQLAVGADTYAFRVQQLQDGPISDQIGAAVLRADPVSSAIVAGIRKWAY